MKRIGTILFFVAVLQIITFGQTVQNRDKSESIPFYFPLDAFQDSAAHAGHIGGKHRGKDMVVGISEFLFALREPVLYNDTSSVEAYRFTWLRTFHSPIAVRLEKEGDSYTLYWKQTDGAAGYRTGSITTNKLKTVDSTAWHTMQSMAAQVSYWELPTLVWVSPVVHDGAAWILEGKSQGKYHVVDRWSPNEGSDFFQLCDFLLGLTDLEIKPREKY
jgi:hypothetical protein